MPAKRVMATREIRHRAAWGGARPLQIHRFFSADALRRFGEAPVGTTTIALIASISALRFGKNARVHFVDGFRRPRVGELSEDVSMLRRREQRVFFEQDAFGGLLDRQERGGFPISALTD
jgi:hypothetical protein